MEIISRLIILTTLIKLYLSHIIIKSPRELKESFNNKPIKVSLSNFGRIPYGYNLIGKLYYDPENTDVDMACKDIKTIEIGENHPIDESPIVMVDR
jgi:hypothetical protein